MFDRQIETRFLAALERMERGALTLTTPDGIVRRFEGPRPGAQADLVVLSPAVFTAIGAKGDVGFAEVYRDGLCESADLPALLTLALQNETAMAPFIAGNALQARFLNLLYLLDRNSRRGSRRNIAAHYDLGNAFYALWLDPTMTYSAGIYGPCGSLEGAQTAKYDRILDQLGAPSGRLLEIGCGWGGFAARAQVRGDFALKGLTLSAEQARFARGRLGPGAQIALQDYRDERGRYDHIVSIEMFEAVGERWWPAYFGKIRDSLATRGRAMVQTITIADPIFETYRRGSDLIRSHVFPGGMLPSPARFAQEAARAGLRIEDGFAFGQDYARTLRDWLAAFEARLPEVRGLGYDEGFIRLWRSYLAACIAGFATGRTDVVQYRLAHA